MEPDPYGIPEGFSGPISPVLPELLGRIVMLSALIETKIWYLASSVGHDIQERYARERVSGNIKLARDYLARSLDSKNEIERKFAESTLGLLDECEEVLVLRNSLVHGVWPEAGNGKWTMWKPIQKKAEQGQDWIDLREFSGTWLEEFIGHLIQIVQLAERLIAEAGSVSFESRTDFKR